MSHSSTSTNSQREKTKKTQAQVPATSLGYAGPQGQTLPFLEHTDNSHIAPVLQHFLSNISTLHSLTFF